MQTFLTAVATDIIHRHGERLDRIAIVFPNKRASLFLNQELARLTQHPIWSPVYITISELFRRQSRLVEADHLICVAILHQVVTEVTGSNESLDDFWNWGETLLSDFDDIDKHLVDAEHVLKNITDLKQLDSLDYLSDNQRELLRQFFMSFAQRESQIQRSFASLWSNLYSIYVRFKAELMHQGIAYEGMIYRDVIEHGEMDFPYDRYLFIGFNLLQEVEVKLFEAAKATGKAEFYWDYDNSYVAEQSAFFDAGQYIKRYNTPRLFPSQLDSDCEIYNMALKEKHIDFISSTSDTLQSSYVAKWLCEEITTTSPNGETITMPRYMLGNRCAVVLCDEKLLSSVLSYLPEEIQKANVTIGFPLQCSPATSLVRSLLSLRLDGMKQSNGLFRMRHTANLLRHPYISLLSEHSQPLLAALLQEHRYWIELPSLLRYDDDKLRLLFDSVSREGDENCPVPPLAQLLRWCREVIHAIGVAAGDENPLITESLYRMHTLLGRLESLIAKGLLDIEEHTLRRLIDRLINTTAVPFHGEPAEGVQIMGVLETRNLDFEHVLVLSASDGNMPKTSAQSSVVPYNVRKAYGLTLPDHQVSIYAYYFYRLLQRARHVSLCYNSNTDVKGQAEMSRFMLQLLVASKHRIHRQQICLQPKISFHETAPVEKNSDIMAVIDSRTTVSPSEIAKYMRCPMLYYYVYVLGLREPSSAIDEIENTDFGIIFHYSMETIYRQLTADMSRPLITAAQLKEFLKQPHAVERVVDKAFYDKFFFQNKPNDSSNQTNPRYIPQLNGIEAINHSAVCTFVRRTLQSDILIAPFAIRGLEERSLDMDIALPNGKTLRLNGSIDRLDQVTLADGTTCLRVIDYKTGRSSDDEPEDLAGIFDLTANPKWHPNYYLQALLYSLAVSKNPKLNPQKLPVAPALLFVAANEERRQHPILRVNGQEILSAEQYRELIVGGVTDLLMQIRNTEQPFQPTSYADRCQQCAFAKLCQR